MGTVFGRLAVVFALGRRMCGVGGFLVASCAGLHATNYTAGSWPIEVTLTADQPATMVGEPAWLSFTVTNLSDEPLQILVGGDYENDIGRPESFTIKTEAKDGRPVAQPEVRSKMGGLIDARDLPAGESHVFRLFLPHWATLTREGSYTITCRRTLQLLRPGARSELARDATTDLTVEERATVRVEPRNEARMRDVITMLGETMLAADGGRAGDEATIALAWINDARVAPYFRRALQIRSYALKFVAVQVLGRFASDEAFEGLIAAMGTTAADFDYPREKGVVLAGMIRAAAAGALTVARHPKAREFLMVQRKDEAEQVRMMVMRVMARLPLTRAIPLLEEMKSDPSELVRDGAQRYLDVLRRVPTRR